jgi:CHAT domain-containing protein
VSGYSSSVSSIPTPIGITIGKYENRSDLRFSKKLVGMLEDNYEIERTDVLTNLQNSGIALLLSHASGSMNQRKGQLVITDDHSLTVDDIFSLKLKNELVLVTACNTNSSTSYKGEGAVGNFTKALRYAGSKSTITTSWEIDEKTNAFFLTQYLEHLSSGHDKSTALHMAKKDYWSQNHTTDDMYRPVYWAPYILTGNTSRIPIAQKMGYPVSVLGLTTGGLVVLLSLLFIRKTRFAKQ